MPFSSVDDRKPISLKWGILICTGLTVITVIAIYELMAQDNHFFWLEIVGGTFGVLIGWVFAGKNGWMPGFVTGYLLPLFYLPFWFVFKLPPYWDCDL